MAYFTLYILAFFLAFFSSFIFTPIARKLAKKANVYDYPHTNIKTHKEPVPYFGGLAIVASFYLTMLVIRLSTDFPTGTLRSLRGIFAAGFFVFLLGIIDDIKHKGLHFSQKFAFQLISSVVLIFYGIKINFISPDWFAVLVTVVWIVGITNAFNIIDIMDGLSSGTAVIAALAFFFVGIPAEEQIYVNFAAIGLAGAILGFMPFNLSKKYKIFMGDAGSLFIGVVLSAIALGTNYTQSNRLGVLAPILILAIPIYDTLFVMYVRYKKRLSPFLGSKDHFALRLRAVGCSDKGILLRVYLAGIILLFGSFIVSKVEREFEAALIYFFFMVVIILISRYLYKIKISL